jgi:acyl transferase domain-containing protein
MAYQAIKHGNCEMAITGGVRIMLSPVEDENYKIGIESSDGITRSFDDESEGTGIGEGCVVMLLKSYAKAVRDRDHIYAVIKGSAVNHDGYSMGITAPNPKSQTEVILKAWQDAGIHPETLFYIETHGTGTKIGDVIEIEGLQAAFDKYTKKKQICAIGSLKSNIGHLYDCAGIAGLLKVVLSIKHSEIPPTINFIRPNSKTFLPDTPFFMNTRIRKYDKKEPMRCGISSFGLSGTNIHMVVEKPLDEVTISSYQGKYIFVLSAKSRKALKEIIHQYEIFCHANPQADLGNICYTACTGRGNHSYRIAFIAENFMDFYSKIIILCNKELSEICEKWFLFGFGESESNETPKESLDHDDFVQEVNQRLVEFVEKDKTDEEAAFLICQLYVNGADPNWEILFQGEKMYRISLPTYCFERKSFWLTIPERINEKEKETEKENTLGASELKTQAEDDKPEEVNIIPCGRSDGNYSEWEKKLVQIVGTLIQVREVNVNDNFFDLGLDSIVGLRIINSIRKQTQKDIQMAEIFNYATISKLAQHLSE